MSDAESPSGDPASTSPPAAVVRSQEQLAIARTVRIRGAVRLHKRVVTETVTQTVEVRREELVITELTPEEVSLPATLAAHDGTAQLHEAEFALVLHEERVVVTTEVVPVERVRVRVRIVTADVEVEESVRQERVSVLGGEGSSPGREPA